MLIRNLSVMVVVSALVGFPLLATPATAQTEIAKQAIAKAEATVKKIMVSCKKDVNSYCSTVTPGQGRIALCIMAHEDKISDQCFDAILDAADGISLAISNIQRAADVCEADIDKVCAKVQLGEGHIAQCLISNKSKISSACRAEVAGFEARMKN